ncbi:uncharacterized protein MELLADRAFT_91179 [Melampsora larici-populina 98AG31]|uniref:Uncharacterized protein n=1 Tax=Melampsora larici-populina (strain 98AG31 / pathotype 3-4-7) TaxID=747676 RepID=F4RY42_MELLP|nr:uncharacterized protein MELLADRAFT_91179 [Melampsora larici-populina 98AG31]EGG02615.1 hypothetical protein MELLADRAFT_91179 [Melampsora larici-populina 98AG31]
MIIIGIGLRYKSSIDQPTLKTFYNPTTSCKILKYSSDHHHPSNTNELKYCEDLIHWEIGNLLIVSCDGGRKDWNTVMGPLRNPNPRGKLYIHHLDRPSSSSTTNESKDNLYSLQLIGFPIESDFHPLGIELYPQDQFTARLFVVNHRRDRSVIEVFQIRTPKENEIQVQVKWLFTLTDPLLNTPNSILAFNSNSLLVTNDHFINRRQYGALGAILHSIETIFRLPGGNVISLEFEDFGQESAQVKIHHLTFPNGIAMTQDRSMLIIATSTPMKLLSYQIHHPDSNLNPINFSFLDSRQLNFGPDNLSIDAQDRLIISGHPNAPKIFLWVFNSNLFPPPGSLISLLNLQNGFQSELEDLFQDDGEFFMTSSTGLIIKDQLENKMKLLASGLYQIGLLECVN